MHAWLPPHTQVEVLILLPEADLRYIRWGHLYFGDLNLYFHSSTVGGITKGADHMESSVKLVKTIGAVICTYLGHSSRQLAVDSYWENENARYFSSLFFSKKHNWKCVFLLTFPDKQISCAVQNINHMEHIDWSEV